MMKGNKSFLHVLKNPPLSLGLRIKSNYYYCTSNNDESSKVANLDDAVKVFEGMTLTQPLPSVEKFNELLGVVNKMKHYSSTVDFFKHMCSLGLPVDYDTMKTVINSCCQFRCTNKGGFAVFGCCLKRGVIPDVFTFNTLLNGLIRENKILDAEILLKDLINKGICEPNAIMYNAIIKALCNLGGKTHVNKAVGYIRLMVERGRKPNLVGYSTIIDSLCKEQLIDEAFELFKEMQGRITPDIITYNSLIYGFCNSARWLEASDLLKEMMDNSISPNLQTFNILLNEYSKRGKINRAEEVIYIMREKGFLPNIVTYNSLIDCYCKRGDMNSAKRILDSLVFRHAVPDIVTYNTLVYGYSMNRRRDMDQAMLVFDKMKAKRIKPNEFTYKSLITGFCSVGRFKEASKLVTVMHAEGLVPDRFTYQFLMEGFCTTKQVEDAFSLFTFMGDCKLNYDFFVHHIIIEWANKCGKLDIATAVSSSLRAKGMDPNACVYAWMIDQDKELMNDAMYLW